MKTGILTKIILIALVSACSPVQKNQNTPQKTNEKQYRLNLGLHSAARRGDLKELSAILKKGGDLKTRDGLGNNLLLLAVRGNADGNFVRELIRLGVPMDSTDPRGKTALCWAAHKNRLEPVQILVESGADLKRIDDKGRTAFLWAAYRGNISIMKYLLQKGADINKRNSYGETALSISAVKGKETSVRFLLKEGADPSIGDADGLTPLDRARKHRRRKVIELFAGASLN